MRLVGAASREGPIKRPPARSAEGLRCDYAWNEGEPTPDGRTLSRRRAVASSFRQVSWLAGYGVGPTPSHPECIGTVEPGWTTRLQWRYRGGLSPPSLFSPIEPGHLNG